MLDFKRSESAEAALKFFEDISKIPHGSGNTKYIADYLVEFARECGLECHRDEYDNVIIKKPASAGYENKAGIIFQGHLDMVAEKLPTVDKDMESEGLEIYIDGEFLRAKGTSLGGDDGVALAYAMAILDGEYEHPAFEAVFTSDEEIGLVGANNIDGSLINGRMLINIDSDEEGVFTVGCAGGMRSDINLPVSRARYDGNTYSVKVTGLMGGHSGIEIDKGRLNANKLLAELLNCDIDYRIISINGGNADNAIPRECVAVISLPVGIEVLAKSADALVDKYRAIENALEVEIEPVSTSDTPFDEESTCATVALLCELPSGVIAMSEDISGLVETSLNLGTLKTEDNYVSASFSVRSSKGKSKRALGDTLQEIAVRYGADYSERGEYPAWEYRRESHLRDVMKSVYENMYGKEPQILTIHAGLECGLFTEKIPGIDCVSIGPDNFDIHTTDEHLSLPSFVRVWEYLLNVLKNI